MIELAIKIYFICLGVLFFAFNFYKLYKKRVSFTFGVLWLFFSFLIVLLGIFITPSGWFLIIGVPSLVLLGISCILIMLFLWSITKSIDNLKQSMEDKSNAIQHLKDENQRLKNAVASINSKVIFNSNSAFYKNLKNIKNSKVLFVINTLGYGGAEKQLLNTMKDFISLANSVDLFVITGQGELINQIPKDVKVLNKKFDDISVLDSKGQKILKKKVIKAEFSHFNIIKYAPYQFVSFFKMLQSGKIFKEKPLWLPLAMSCESIKEEYDYAIAFTEGAATHYVAKKVKAKNKYAFVHIVYDQAGYNDYIDNRAYEEIDMIFAVSNEVRTSFNRVHPECVYKTFIIENELNAGEVLEKSQDFVPQKSSEYVFVSVGRLTQQKGFDKSVEAAKILKKQGIDFKWYLYGDGPEYNELNWLIKKCKVQNSFILKGKVDNPYPYMRACDIFVHATQFEGKSIALREAKILGCVTIVSDVEGNRETVVDGYDALMCNPEPDDIAQKIAMLLNDKSLYKYIKSNVAVLE